MGVEAGAKAVAVRRQQIHIFWAGAVYMPETLLLFGCGGHSRSVADIYLTEHPNAQLIFIDEKAHENETIFGFPVVRTLAPDSRPYFFAIGDNVKRLYICQTIGTEGLISILSSKAHYGVGSFWERGCFVGNFCHLGPSVRIGLNTIVNNGAILEHEVRVGNHCHIGPGAVISGRSIIGDLVFVGVGATIKDNLEICSSVTIGAGATVVKSINEPGVYVGCPAKKVVPHVHSLL